VERINNAAAVGLRVYRKPENFVHSGSTRKVCAWKARGEASYYDTLSRHYRFHIYIYIPMRTAFPFYGQTQADAQKKKRKKSRGGHGLPRE